MESAVSRQEVIEAVPHYGTNPFVFIVGCSRSGTTLLQRMVDAHPQIGIIPETRWFARAYEKGENLTPEGFVTPEFVTCLRHRLFRDVDLQIKPEELYGWVGVGRSLPYSSFVARLFDRYGRVRGKPLVGNKTPGHVRRIAILNALFPQAKFVHIIRDARDVCLSATNWKKAGKMAARFASWNEDPISTAALWWEWGVRLGREAGRSLPAGLYHEVRYEALVANPAAELASLCQFLGVPYDEAMLRYHEQGVKMASKGEVKHAATGKPPTAGLRDWRTQMPAEDVERVVAAAGELLDELGYPRGCAQVSAKELAHAARLRSRFEGRPLPARWQVAVYEGTQLDLDATEQLVGRQRLDVP